MRVFLEMGREVTKQYADRIEMNDRLVDTCAMELVIERTLVTLSPPPVRGLRLAADDQLLSAFQCRRASVPGQGDQRCRAGRLILLDSCAS